MRLYEFLARIFPRSYIAKVLFIAFIGLHVPMIGVVLSLLFSGRALGDELRILLTLLIATGLGTAATLAALFALFRPLSRIERTLWDLEVEGKARELPEGFRDEIGRLMQRVNRMARRMGERLDNAARDAERDPLTGALNRVGLAACLPHDISGAVLFMDIDHFKAVNDDFGHAEGDRVLVEFVRLVDGQLRRRDSLVRLGGEEFVAVLPGVGRETAAVIAERVRSEVAEQLSAGSRPVTVSIGIALANAGAPEALRQLIEDADAAVYAAKRSGRNQVRLAGMLPDVPSAPLPLQAAG